MTVGIFNIFSHIYQCLSKNQFALWAVSINATPAQGASLAYS
jgi:hypothetical protein